MFPLNSSSENLGTSSNQGRIEELQKTFEENTRKLEEIRQMKMSAELEIVQMTKETKERVDLMMGLSEVVDVLQQLGLLLQEERALSEQQDLQASADRKQRNDIQGQLDSVMSKARSLAAEILEVKTCLAEAQAHCKHKS